MNVVYRVPGLAELRIDSSVLAHVREAIEFQLGYFRVIDESPSPADLPVIRVEPYARLQQTARTHFHQWRGELRAMMQNSDARHATVRHPMGFDVFSDTPEVLVVLLLQLLALRTDRSFIHAAAWADGEGCVTLVPGPGGVGKTALASAAVQQHGAQLLGDDLVLVGPGGSAAAFPRAFVLKAYHRELFPSEFATADAATTSRIRGVRRLLVKAIRENVPFHGMLKALARRAGRLDAISLRLQRASMTPDFHAVPVAQLFGAGRIAIEGTVARVVYLERHDGEDFVLESMEPASVAARSLAVLHHEWADYLRWFCALGALEVFDMGAYFRRTEQVLHRTCAAAPCQLVRVPAATSPMQLAEWFAENVGFHSSGQ